MKDRIFCRPTYRCALLCYRSPVNKAVHRTSFLVWLKSKLHLYIFCWLIRQKWQDSLWGRVCVLCVWPRKHVLPPFTRSPTHKVTQSLTRSLTRSISVVLWLQCRPPFCVYFIVLCCSYGCRPRNKETTSEARPFFFNFTTKYATKLFTKYINASEIEMLALSMYCAV